MLEQLEKKMQALGQMPAFRRKRKYTIRGGGVLFQDSNESPLGEIVAHFPQRAPCQPDARERPLVQYRTVAAGQVAFHTYGAYLPILLQKPPLRLIALLAKRQAVVVKQIVGCVGAPMALQIVRGGDNDPLVVSETLPDDA